MATKSDIEKNNSESLKMARSIALSLSALSIALAAFCLALLSFTSNQIRLNVPAFDKAIPIALVILTCPPKADPLIELGLAKGDRTKCQGNISRLNRLSAN